MRVLVCIKRVPMAAGKIVLTADEREIETKHLGFTISPHEECAIEEAVRLVEANGGESVVLTLGPADAVEQLRDAMAVGVSRAIHLETDGEEWDGEATAAAIVDAIRADEEASGVFDVVLFGNESADAGGYQVGIRVAWSLGRPAVRGVKGLSVTGTGLRVEQEATGGRDVYELPVPAIVTVLEGLNVPRYPSVPGRIRARSKPVASSRPHRPAPRLEMVRLVVPEGKAKGAEILGEGPGAAAAVVEILQGAGVV
jgi:electron transfer flavoprotein beta subunit